jgi:hypothetical protein
MADRTVLEERRQRLENRVEAFHEKLDAMTDGVDYEDTNAQHLQNVDEENNIFIGDDGEESEWEEEDREGEEVGEEEKNEVVECMTLFMPSYLKPADRQRLGFGRIAKQELELRRGQANDSLNALRIALGHKALLFRTDVSR